MKSLFAAAALLLMLSFAGNAQNQTVQIDDNVMTVENGKADLQLHDVSLKSGLRLMADKIPSRSDSQITWLGNKYSITYTSDKKYLLTGNGTNVEFANKSELKKHLISI